MKKYHELLKLGKEKLSEMIAPLRANEMKKKAELYICQLESEIAEKEQKVQEAMGEYPVNFDNILSHLDRVHLTKRKLEQLQKLHKDMF
jgi:hypothetical protein